MEDKKKKYILVEFPYPSGSGLHIGHAFNYMGADVYARFMRMRGYEVCFPMGWDAFGLPTENYAIKEKRKPQDITAENTAKFRRQMDELGFSFDWEREINTTDPKYYKWTQWIFTKLFEKGLTYKKEMPINWCSSCKMGLANEEVVGGKCERCSSQVSQRNISQWIVKITDYADRLIDGLGNTQIIDKVKQAQINWIGKSVGAKIRFQLSSDSTSILSCSRPSDDCVRKIKIGFGNDNCEIEVFTTRPDTLPSATFIVLAPEHPLIANKLMSNLAIKHYIEETRKKSEFERGEMSKEKTGVFTGLYAINPFNNKKMPIWVSDFVLSSYGTGAIMSVPTQDERDKEFAEKFGLEIVDEPNLTWEESLKYGEETSNYHLRDWIFSRQHYWGEPIPMINCPKCGWVIVPENQLPVILPEIDYYEPTDTGESPLSKIDSFVNTTCPKCGAKAKRETDTMPNWAGSDWYYLRYLDPHNDKELCSMDLLKKWMPVDLYFGGDEHNTLHLLYSRFINQFLYDLGVVPVSEPYQKRVSHGVILGPDNQRMSKSRGNVIVPETLIKEHGVDTLRTYLMFMGPFDNTMAWNDNAVLGIKRFIKRFKEQILQSKNIIVSSQVVIVKTNELVGDITKDIEIFHFNTAIAKMMEFLNSWKSNNWQVGKTEREALIKMISVFAPFTANELLPDVSKMSWPDWIDDLSVSKEVQITICINGKVRAQLVINKKDREMDVIKKAKQIEAVKFWLKDKEIKKSIYVPEKMLNLVVGIY